MGTCVERAEGANVGNFEGFILGAMVGTLEGLRRLGKTEGYVEGFAVGRYDGLPEGPWVGEDDGDADGILLGDADGNPVGI